MVLIDFEVGDVVYWCSIDGRKPFPINVYKKNGEWKHQAHAKLSEEERISIEGFVRERLHEMYEIWKPNMKTRLNWNKIQNRAEQGKT